MGVKVGQEKDLGWWNPQQRRWAFQGNRKKIKCFYGTSEGRDLFVINKKCFLGHCGGSESAATKLHRKHFSYLRKTAGCKAHFWISYCFQSQTESTKDGRKRWEINEDFSMCTLEQIKVCFQGQGKLEHFFFQSSLFCYMLLFTYI